MVKWEYRYEEYADIEDMNEYAQDNWEIVNTTGKINDSDTFIGVLLKRPLEVEEEGVNEPLKKWEHYKSSELRNMIEEMNDILVKRGWGNQLKL